MKTFKQSVKFLLILSSNYCALPQRIGRFGSRACAFLCSQWAVLVVVVSVTHLLLAKVPCSKLHYANRLVPAKVLNRIFSFFFLIGFCTAHRFFFSFWSLCLCFIFRSWLWCWLKKFIHLIILFLLSTPETSNVYLCAVALLPETKRSEVHIEKCQNYVVNESFPKFYCFIVV